MMTSKIIIKHLHYNNAKTPNHFFLYLKKKIILRRTYIIIYIETFHFTIFMYIFYTYIYLYKYMVRFHNLSGSLQHSTYLNEPHAELCQMCFCYSRSSLSTFAHLNLLIFSIFNDLTYIYICMCVNSL